MRKILLFLLFFQILTSYAQQLRQWTNTEGRSFSGTIVDCDGETAKYKVFGRNKLVEIPLSMKILEGEFKKGDKIEVGLENNKLVFNKI